MESSSNDLGATRDDAPELVSVVVPSRNEEETIGACIRSILAQDYTNVEIIVIDGASTDRTQEIVRSLASRDARVRLVSNPRSSIPNAMNLGLAEARGTWLVRVDAHSTIPPGYISRAVGHLRTGSWGAVGGRKDAVGVTNAGRAIAAAMGSRFGVGNSTYHHGTRERTVDHVPFGAYPITLLRRLGGWDERIAANEDYELDYRLRQRGYRLLFDPEMAIEWRCRQAIADLFRQYRRYGRGKALVARLHPESLSLRHVLPPAFIIGLAGAALVAVRRPRLAAAAAGPYLVALGAASAIVSLRVDAGARRHVPGAFLSMHVGWGLGFWEGLLGRKP